MSLSVCMDVLFCLTLGRMHLYDLNFLFSLLDSCECGRRIEVVWRGEESRGDEKRAGGIKNQVRSRLYLTGNCETAKYKKTFPISTLPELVYGSAPPV